MVWSMTGDEYLAAVPSGDPPTFSTVIASGTSATIPRGPPPGSAWDGLVLLQSPRGPGQINSALFQIGAGVIVDDSGIPQTLVTLAPSTDGGSLDRSSATNQEPVRFRGATPTTNPGAYTTTGSGTVVIDDTAGTFALP